ncbi:hypothetical protein [Rhodoferax sp. BAB1]|uniref:hypothetical protein n=1 Tax=Rhodoferax sp. BAB1 TaxID=2741720 RepID=UPI0015765A2B|nr:hypothetical protein [Rhodoferax sp. BAB1]MDP3699275.1 hypothetical protein [Hylemonella sp.]QKO21268.1 hypothetical protein HTY51_04910 [Rhodoferax sp. BAB1]
MGRALSPHTTFLLSTGAFIALSVVTSAFGIASPWLTLNENQILYLFSTTAQVIAAVYGLTLTGFLFFRNELTREANEDETLEEAIDELKTRYFKLLVYITGLVALTLLLANLVISHETSPQTDLTTILINVGQSAFAVAFAAITLFVFDVIAPQRIERASQNLQDELDPSRDREARGSLEDFLRNYNQIEGLLSEAGEPYQSYATASAQARLPRRMSNMRLADILFRSERINGSLHGHLRELITLRNAIIHGAEPIVSQEIVATSATVLAELRAVLQSER